MKRLLFGTLLAFMFVFALAPVTPEPAQVQATECAKIKDGTIKASTGETLTLGYDQFGYNYQARIFNGTYATSDRTDDGLYWGSAGDYTDDSLIMKWSDDWLSNQDCDHDGKLDRGAGGTSLGWTTNLVEGDYIGDDLDSHHYTYFVKIVYDAGAVCIADPDDPLCLWGLYRIIEEVYNDPYGGFHGVDKSKLANPAGLGFYTK